MTQLTQPLCSEKETCVNLVSTCADLVPSGLACEFFALDVPVHMAKDVAGMMNFLSARAVHAEEVRRDEGNGQLYRLHAVGAKRRRQLMRTHLTQVTPGATFLQLVPIGGWAEVAVYATPFVPSCPCGGPGCAFCH